MPPASRDIAVVPTDVVLQAHVGHSTSEAMPTPTPPAKLAARTGRGTRTFRDFAWMPPQRRTLSLAVVMTAEPRRVAPLAFTRCVAT